MLIVPLGVRTEPGHLRVAEDETEQPAVIQTLLTQIGEIAVAIPKENVGELINGLKTARDELEKAPITKSDLYIPKSDAEVEGFAKELKEINQPNATRD